MANRILLNPFAKTRKALQLTQADLAVQVGVSRNFISRAENGEYPVAPRILLEFYSGGDSEHSEILSNLYTAYQNESRKDAYGLLDPSVSWEECPVFIHPLNWWIVLTNSQIDSGNRVTLYEICKHFCVHHSVMTHWLNDATVKHVPKIFLAALFESGYSESILIALEVAYENYRKEQLSGSRPDSV